MAAKTLTKGVMWLAAFTTAEKAAGLCKDTAGSAVHAPTDVAVDIIAAAAGPAHFNAVSGAVPVGAGFQEPTSAWHLKAASC